MRNLFQAKEFFRKKYEIFFSSGSPFFYEVITFRMSNYIGSQNAFFHLPFVFKTLKVVEKLILSGNVDFSGSRSQFVEKHKGCKKICILVYKVSKKYESVTAKSRPSLSAICGLLNRCDTAY